MQLLHVQLFTVLLTWLEGCYGETQDDNPETGQGPIDVLKNQDVGKKNKNDFFLKPKPAV